MKQVMEQLRSLWEKHEGYEAKFDKGMIRVDLFDKSGQSKMGFELLIYQEGLEQLLVARIEKGVRNFFDSLKRALENPIAKGIDTVHILLAGNSSKSQIVVDLFNQYISKEKENDNQDAPLQFEMFPPLGTEEAYVKQEECEVHVDRNVITSPTGKTGVAFGLVQSAQRRKNQSY